MRRPLPGSDDLVRTGARKAVGTRCLVVKESDQPSPAEMWEMADCFFRRVCAANSNLLAYGQQAAGKPAEFAEQTPTCRPRADRRHLENCIASTIVLGFFTVQVTKGSWWMPWRWKPKKDVAGCEKPREAVKQASIRGCPNGETWPG